MRGQVKDIEFDYNIKGQILSYLVLEFFLNQINCLIWIRCLCWSHFYIGNKSVMNALGICEEINLNGVEHEIERTLCCFIDDVRCLIFFIAATLFSIVQLGF